MKHPPTVLPTIPNNLGKKKLPYTKPTVELLSTPSVTHSKRYINSTEGGGIYAASVGS
jgi:hypothetical protein